MQCRSAIFGGKSVATSKVPLVLTQLLLSTLVRMRGGNGVVRNWGKTGSDRAGELTSDLWPGRTVGVKSKPN